MRFQSFQFRVEVVGLEQPVLSAIVSVGVDPIHGAFGESDFVDRDAVREMRAMMACSKRAPTTVRVLWNSAAVSTGRGALCTFVRQDNLSGGLGGVAGAAKDWQARILGEIGIRL